jgi:hypothetical protein
MNAYKRVKISLLLLAFLLGFSVNLAEITAQASLLDTLSAQAWLILTLVAGTTIYFTLGALGRNQKRFLTMVITMTVAYGIALAGFAVWQNPSPTYTILLFLTTLVGGEFLVWAIYELAIRYLPPHAIGPYFLHLAGSFEAGTLAVVLALRYRTHLFPATTVQLLSSSLTLLIAAIIFWAFRHQGVREVQLERKDPAKLSNFRDDRHASPRIKKAVKRLFMALAALGLMVGVFKGNVDFLFALGMKATGLHQEQITQAISDQFVWSCLVMIPLNGLMAKWIGARQPSHRLMLLIFSIGGLLSVMPLMFSQSLASLVFLAASYRVFFKAILIPETERIFSGFSETFRIQVRGIFDVFDFAVCGIPLAIIAWITQSLTAKSSFDFLIGVHIVVGVSCIALSIVTAHRWVMLAWLLALRGRKSDRVRAATSLGSAPLKTLVRKIGYLLGGKLDKGTTTLIRKALIGSMGYAYHKAPSEEDRQFAIDKLKAEFETDREEIQIAVLRALVFSGHYRAIEFADTKITNRTEYLRFGVRRASALFLKKVLGNHTIALFVHGVDAEDPHLIADTVEILALFKNRTLIPEFRRIAETGPPRAQAAAIIGLAQYPEYRLYVTHRVNLLLLSSEIHSQCFGLYALGQTRLKTIPVSTLAQYRQGEGPSNSKVRAYLAWALTRLGDPAGDRALARVLFDQFKNSRDQSIFQLYVHLSKDDRYRVIMQVLTLLRSTSEVTPEEFARFLKNSGFDFQAEREVLLASEEDEAA